MGKAFELKATSKCGTCKNLIKEGDIFDIIYKDDDSGKIKQLICDNCDVDDRIQAYRDTKVVNSKLSLEAHMAQYYFEQDGDLKQIRAEARRFYMKYKKDLLEIAEGTDKIKGVIREFETNHWIPYLKKYWNDSKERGHEAMVGKIKVLMWGCAGRVLVTVSFDDQSVTMIFTDEKSQLTPNGGQQGIDATVVVATKMLETVTSEKKLEFHPEEAVKLAGL